MQRHVANIVLLGVVFVLGRMSAQLPASAEGQAGFGEAEGACADLNDDTFVDLTDAVHLLSWLYQGGPAPVCPDPPVAPGGRLPDSGQTVCYDETGAIIPCDDTSCPSQDGRQDEGCPAEGRFEDNGDGTVTDSCTGLMWQKDPGSEEYTWCEALRHCDGLALGGHDDWRLPTVRELQSIVDYGRSNPAIDPVFLAGPSRYWTSTTYDSSASAAWFVFFHFGIVSSNLKDVPYRARAVRAAP